MLGFLQLMRCCRAEIDFIAHPLWRVSSWSFHSMHFERKVFCQGLIFSLLKFWSRLATIILLWTQNAFIYPPTNCPVSQTVCEIHICCSHLTSATRKIMNHVNIILCFHFSLPAFSQCFLLNLQYSRHWLPWGNLHSKAWLSMHIYMIQAMAVQPFGLPELHWVKINCLRLHIHRLLWK